MAAFGKDTRSSHRLIVGVAIFFVVGVGVGQLFDIGVWCGVLGVMVGLLWMWFWGQWGGVALMALSLGCFASSLDRVAMGEPVGAAGGDCVVCVESANRLRVELCRDGSSGEWLRSRDELYFGSSDSCGLSIGSRYVVRVEPRGKGRLGYTYINKGDVLATLESSDGLRRIGRTVNEWMYGRLQGLSLSHDAESMCAAILLGRRSGLSGARVESYIRGGGAHLLAVSGLHVGLLILAFGVLLRPLVLLRGGVVWSRVLLMVVVVCYSVVVGMSASVVRAVLMAVVVGVGILATRRYDLLRSICVAAVAMLAVWPGMVFEVSFVLSFVAILAICLWAVPISQRVFMWSLDRGWGSVVRWGFNFVVGALIVSVCCTVATLPYVGYTFGRVSLLGALAAPLVVSTTFVVMLLSLAWVFVGFGALRTIFATFLEFVVWLQNWVVEYFASGWRAGAEVDISLSTMVLCYAFYGVASVVAWRLASGRKGSA